jgi:hypothetical protein
MFYFQNQLLQELSIISVLYFKCIGAPEPQELRTGWGLFPCKEKRYSSLP